MANKYYRFVENENQDRIYFVPPDPQTGLNGGVTLTEKQKIADIDNKEAKGKITISGVEKTADTHTVTIVTNGQTATMTLVGVS